MDKVTDQINGIKEGALLPPHGYRGLCAWISMKKLFRLDVLAEENDFELLSGHMALSVPFGWEEESLPTGQTRFRIHCEQEDWLRAFMQGVQELVPQAHCVLDSLEEQDWLAAWRQFFTPVCCGSRFVVLPPWLANSDAFPGRMPIVIEPKSAFGTGHHATTALCLKVLSDLLDSGRVGAGQSFLDLGTGSGVLGIACCKNGLSGLGLDIDPLAISNALENKELNQISGFDLAVGSIEMAEGRHFDVVLANILARPLIEMAAQLRSVLQEGGCLVLSGLLEIQAQGVIAAYVAQGMPEPQIILDGEWCALLWQ